MNPFSRERNQSTALFAVACALPWCAGSAVAQFWPVGVLPGGDLTFANSLGEGPTIVGLARMPNGFEGIRWTAAAGLQGLGQISAGVSYSSALDVSRDGLVVVGQGDVLKTFLRSAAFRWTPQQGYELLPNLPGFVQAAASGVSGNGLTIVGGCWNSSSELHAVAWVWGQAPRELPGLPGATQTTADAVSFDGSFAVGVSGTNFFDFRPVRWTNGVVEALPFPPGHSTASASDVSDDGQTVVGAAGFNETTTVVRWRMGGKPEVLAPLPGGTTASVYVVSPTGEFVAGYSVVPGQGDVATLWDGAGQAHDVRALLLASGFPVDAWKFRYLTGVSADGLTLAGSGRIGAGDLQAWVATLPTGNCYANCDRSTAAPILNVADFICFMNKFAALDPYADCNHSTTPPTLNAADFLCYMNSYAAGCP